MENQFNRAFKKVSKQIELPLTGNTNEIWNILAQEIGDKFDIYNNFTGANLEEVKRHLYSRIETSELEQDNKDYYQNALNYLKDWPMFFIFIRQQVQGY